MDCPPVRKIIHSLKLVGYLHVQADNTWYNYYLTRTDSRGEKKNCYKSVVLDGSLRNIFCLDELL